MSLKVRYGMCKLFALLLLLVPLVGEAEERTDLRLILGSEGNSGTVGMRYQFELNLQNQGQSPITVKCPSFEAGCIQLWFRFDDQKEFAPMFPWKEHEKAPVPLTLAPGKSKLLRGGAYFHKAGTVEYFLALERAGRKIESNRLKTIIEGGA